MNDTRESPSRRVAREIGSRIQRRRRELQLSQERLARDAGVSRQTISNWECGRTVPDAVMLSRIATCLDTTADGLLGGDAPLIRDRARSTRRELVVIGCIAIALNALSGLVSGLQVGGSAAPSAAFSAFRLGILLATLAWLLSIMHRTRLRTVRQLARFASLASREPGGRLDRVIKTSCHWFLTCYFGSFAVGALLGSAVALAQGPESLSLPGLLAANLFMFGIVAIAATWEGRQDDA